MDAILTEVDSEQVVLEMVAVVEEEEKITAAQLLS